MCSPAAFMLTAGGVNAVGQISQGEQYKRLAEYNAALADQDAADALNRGSIEEGRYRQQIKQLEGTQNVAAGANNLTRSGTVLDLIEDTARIGETDALAIRKNAGRESRSLKMQGENLRLQGKMARRGGRLGAGASLLTSGAQAYAYRKMT